jgi:hypothetical protein
MEQLLLLPKPTNCSFVRFTIQIIYCNKYLLDKTLCHFQLLIVNYQMVT